MKRRFIVNALGGACLSIGVVPKVIAANVCHPLDKISSPNTAPFKKQDHQIKDYLHKMQHFDASYQGDLLIDRDRYPIFETTFKRLRSLQNLVGHGNFNILNFADGMTLASRHADVGAFTKKELYFMESLFYQDARQYGFLGQKTLNEIDCQVAKKDLVKVPHSGNYLYRDAAQKLFSTFKKELGDELILTSGVRSVMKQFLLFLNKAYSNHGNLSLASRSLAPPGYSFHSHGDFDVGQAGYGIANFTDKFTETKVYKRLTELGYLALRYPSHNSLGVRYEPWHIKVHS